MYISAGGSRQRVDRREDSLGAVERAEHLLAEFGPWGNITIVPAKISGSSFGLGETQQAQYIYIITEGVTMPGAKCARLYDTNKAFLCGK